jgi:hypothetical protein
MTGPSTSTAASTKADEKKKKVQLKKIFNQYARTSFLMNVITHELNQAEERMQKGYLQISRLTKDNQD